MQTKFTAAELPPEADDDFQEFLGREAQLLAELRSGAITMADYKRLKEEAWEVYCSRTGRLDVDED
jgi:hypothetical protein